MANLITKEVTDKEEWDSFVTSQAFYTFLHSWAWGEFHKLEGEKIHRVGFYSVKQLVGVALLVIITARRGRFLLCPHGPLLDWNNKALVSQFFKTTREIAQKEVCWFIRISPAIDINHYPLTINYFKNNGYLPAPIHMHAEDSWVLDITPSEDQLLSEMRKTTRYLVRKAEKQGVSVAIKTDEKSFKTFIELHQKHAKGHHYTPFPVAYLEHEWQVFSPEDIALFQAYNSKEHLASAVIIFYGSWAFYYQAITEKSKIPGSYALVWEA
ncbi:MAG: peptidoglycan bridge formation glycyltransferase FemA/FemB family protein, partial [Patescibacteria group bacterium]